MLYNGEIARPEQLLTDLQSRLIQIPETDLLFGEILIAKEQPERAGAVFSGLIDNPRTPARIRTVAQSFLDTINNPTQP